MAMDNKMNRKLKKSKVFGNESSTEKTCGKMSQKLKKKMGLP
jgi:hypothetical protein